MKGRYMGLPHHHRDKEKMEELCCLFALGELPPGEWVQFSQHLQSCGECQETTRELERLILFDLSSATVARMEHMIPESAGFPGEHELLQKIQSRAGVLKSHVGLEAVTEREPSRSRLVLLAQRSHRLAVRSMPWIGWAAAAILLAAFTASQRPPLGRAASVPLQKPSPVTASQTGALQQRLLVAERNTKQIAGKLSDAEIRMRDTEAALARIAVQKRALTAENQTLAMALDQAHGTIVQRTAELDLSHRQLKEETANRESLQELLAEATARVDKQQSELSHLQELASTAHTRLPAAASDLSADEAREILGARDLHIVDVYDVDKVGRSSRVYGRVYDVNGSLLIFYAFDLGKAEKNHKAVAFQAWGYRQPHSTKPESLGLFFMDNARLNRWALRVSDPQLLSRIDTVFVTVEPPGGSRTPRGHRLLMASLAGPANHP